jgi:hypothetical protein
MSVRSASYARPLAGLEVRTNARPSAAEDNRFYDGALGVTFGPAGRLAARRQREPAAWHLVPGAGPPIWLCDDGARAQVEARPERTEADAAVRRVVPFASALQGKVVLHAAAVRCGSAAVAFTGASGAGKSTIAGALGALGLPRLADDLLPCRLDGDRVIVPFRAARRPRAAAEQLPLGLVFVLGAQPTRDAAIHWQPLAPRRALQALVENGYGELAVARAWRCQFELYLRLVATAQVLALEVAHDALRLRASAAELARWLGAESQRP